MNILEVSSVRHVYGKGDAAVKAVDDVSFSVRSGEIVLVMGPSGSGKTTLLSMIGGLLTPTSGTIAINNHNISSLSRKELTKMRLHEVGFVFQSFNMLHNLTALENVQIVAQMAGFDIVQAKKRARDLLSLVHLEDRLDHTPSQLSGGQQQRVAIARSLVNDPGLILADEPTGNLDSKSGYEVMMLFHNIAKEKGKSVLIVSHDSRIKDIADRVIWIEDGKISNAPPEPELLAKDPVCGMRVDEQRSIFKHKYQNEEFTFCSSDCMKKFVDNPKKYLFETNTV